MLATIGAVLGSQGHSDKGLSVGASTEETAGQPSRNDRELWGEG